MNELERALIDPSNIPLDLYLEEISATDFRIEIEQIKNKAASSTVNGTIKKDLQDIINRM
jgi:hypothetical protein